MKLLKLLMTAVVVAGAAQAASASTIDLTGGGSVLLSTLLGPGGDSIRVGDKVFSGFSNYSSVATGTASAVNANQISVLAVPSPPAGEIGIRFQSAMWSVIFGGTQDTQFAFDVTPDAGHLIDDITLTTSGGASYNGGWTVTETVIPGAGAITFQVTNPPPTPDTILATIHKVFAPTATVHVLKDIALNGGSITSPPSSASISSVDQTFSQISTVPSPASAMGGMMLLGGLALYRRMST